LIVATRKTLERQLRGYEAQRDKLTAGLNRVGFIWHGSIHRRRLTCGRAGCKCHESPDARHGPYAYWTTKVGGKTVSRLLTPEEADLYENWIENRRRIEQTIVELKKVSEKAAIIILKLQARQEPKPA
jgi:hypothetical protein